MKINSLAYLKSEIEYFYGDGIIQAREVFDGDDFTGYYLTSYIETDDGQDQDGYYVHINTEGTQTYSSVIDRAVETDDLGRSADSGEDETKIDFDADGNIDAHYKDIWYREFDSEGNLTYINYTELIKIDDTNDGTADTVTLSKTIYKNSSGKVINFYWDSNSDSSAPANLDIQINKDFDGDGTYDSTSELSFVYTPNAILTSMGDHVATIEDTYLMSSDILV